MADDRVEARFTKLTCLKPRYVSLHHFLRPEQKFASEEVLRERIRQDVDAARRYYRTRNTAL